jgi:xanthine dehydrogenase accessory factor
VSDLDRFLQRLAREDAVLVSVVGTRGSVPRESGAWMAVFAEGEIGTIGGGHLEFQATQQARQRLQDRSDKAVQRYPLGPTLGQCCGGEVSVEFELTQVHQADALRQRLQVRRAPVALFGGGHVGHALVHVLAELPLAVIWVDSRDEVFPDKLPSNVVTEHSEPVQGAVAALPAGTHVLIMSFSHAEDLEVVIACLERQRHANDLPFVGLIGSQTKWAVFRHRLQARGYSEAELAQITCPIGVEGIRGKEPAVIAISLAAQLLLKLGEGETRSA